MGRESLDAPYTRWREIDDAIALVPDSLLHEVAENPATPAIDRARALARLYGLRGGHKIVTELQE
jgi:hypothetical protein